MLQFLLQVRLPDGGGIYHETDTDRLIVEPWNAVTAFFFLGIVVFWFLQLRGRWKNHRFLTAILPVLAIGGVGGTLYHAFRVSRWFLMMDWLPILLLCLAGSIYFLIRALGDWRLAILSVVALFTLEFVNFRLVPPHLAVNISYFLMAILVLLPVGLVLRQENWRHARWVGMALAAFSAALLFRVADPWALLPMGTHFLWHVFGALACHCMFMFLFLLNRQENQTATLKV